MEIKVFRAQWGMTERTIQDTLKRIEDAGYTGLETGAPYDEKKRDEWKEAFAQTNLQFIGQMWTRTDISGTIQRTGPALDPDQHVASTAFQVAANAAMNPLYIDCQLGRDYFSFADNCRIIEATNAAAEENGVKVCYETHRTCFSFTPFVMRPFLEKYPWMRITADFSNWCCACETLLQDQPEDVAYALDRADHIHARVGYEHGPQITDPRGPEWEQTLSLHLGWWETILKHHKEKGTGYFCLTPEFGPAGYMHTVPYTNMPVADNWAVNAHMKDLIWESFGREF